MHRYDINNEFIMHTGLTPYALAKCCRSGTICIVSEKLPGVFACPFGCRVEGIAQSKRDCTTITDDDWSNVKIREGNVPPCAGEEDA